MNTKIIDRIKILERKFKKLDLKHRSYFLETQVFSPRNTSTVSAVLSDIARNNKLIKYRLDRTFTPIKISENKSMKLMVKSGLFYALLGFKFLEQDGWGEYGVYKNDVRMRTFSRHENGVESNVALTSSYVIYWENNILKIKQESGFGEQEIELLGITLMPPGMPYGDSSFIETTP